MFYLSIRPQCSCASPTRPFLRIYLSKIFLHIPETYIFTYLLNHNILAHPRLLHFYVSTRPKYSSRIPDTSTSLRIYSTKIFLRIPDTSTFYVSTPPKYSCALSSALPFLHIVLLYYSTRQTTCGSIMSLSSSDGSISSGGSCSSFDSILATRSDDCINKVDDQNYRKRHLHFLLIARIQNSTRARSKKFVPLRLNWTDYVTQLVHQNEFAATFRMSLLSFNKLVESLRVKLEVDADQA